MKKRILSQMILIGISSAVAAFLLCTGIFYKLFQQQIAEELRGYCQTLALSEDSLLDGR